MELFHAVAQLQYPAEENTGRQCDEHGCKNPFRIKYIFLMILYASAESHIRA